ncbi:MAG TPA: DUF4398 domain-containing protein [Lysobacter sp.]|nr:DUF4398 domain-containing protein [Lysobacter sp.]
MAQIRFALYALLICFVTAACSSLPPPHEELSAAQQAVERAAGADADQYAAAEIATARSALLAAQQAMGDGREDEARRLALRAAADADLAYFLSREAVFGAELAQRRNEVTELRQRLDTEEAR